MMTIWRLFFCIFFLFCLGGPLVSAADDLSTTLAEQWPDACQELRMQLADIPWLPVVFSEKPVPKFKTPVWKLLWQGIPIPVPAISYNEMYLIQDTTGEVYFFLKNQKGVVLQAIKHLNPPLTKSALGDVAPQTLAKEDKAMKYFFGGPVSNAEVTILGYEKTLDDLTCVKKDWQQEGGTAIALILKSITPLGELVSVYRDVGKYRGWLEYVKMDNSITYRSWILLSKKESFIYEISMTLPLSSPYPHIGVLIGEDFSRVLAPSPAWLKAFNRALSANSPKSWQQFLHVAREAGFSPESLAKSAENLKINHTQK